MNTPTDWGGFFILIADLDFQGASLIPVGSQPQPFTGDFDGNTYMLRNGVIDQPGNNHVGLFGYVGPGGHIRRLGLEAFRVSGHSRVGGLVGYNYGTVSSCYATGSVSGSYYVGGLVGYNDYGTVSSCYATGAVSGYSGVGGLVGYNVGGVGNSFWNIESSGRKYSYGGTGKTTAQMQDLNTYLGAGWDFATEWSICEGTNYLRLLWQIPAADRVCPDGVGMEDLAHLAMRWLEDNCGAADGCEGADLNMSGNVDLADLAAFAEQWAEGL